MAKNRSKPSWPVVLGIGPMESVKLIWNWWGFSQSSFVNMVSTRSNSVKKSIYEDGSLPAFNLADISSKTFFNSSLSMALTGHPIDKPSVSLGLGITWKWTWGTSCDIYKSQRFLTKRSTALPDAPFCRYFAGCCNPRHPGQARFSLRSGGCLWGIRLGHHALSLRDLRMYNYRWSKILGKWNDGHLGMTKAWPFDRGPISKKAKLWLA